MRVKKRKSFFCIGIMLLSSFFSACTTPLTMMEKCVAEENYLEAAKKADLIKSSEDKKKANEIIKNAVDDIKNSYRSGKTDCVKAISEIESLRSRNLPESFEYIDDAKEELNAVMSSKKSLSYGEECEKNGRFEEALKEYDKVSEKDAENYKRACEKKEALKEALNGNVPVDIQSIAAFNSDKVIRIYLFNKSDKNIKEIQMGIKAYDGSGNLVQIMTKEVQEGSDIMLGTAQNMNFFSQTAWAGQWNILNDNITEVTASIKNVKFVDNTEWYNPLYTEWEK